MPSKIVANSPSNRYRNSYKVLVLAVPVPLESV